VTEPSLARVAGASTRRIAVHFCPAFSVISRATSLTKASKAVVAGAAYFTTSKSWRRTLKLPGFPPCSGSAHLNKSGEKMSNS
jgi:hypothetical protein